MNNRDTFVYKSDLLSGLLEELKRNAAYEIWFARNPSIAINTRNDETFIAVVRLDAPSR